MPDIPISSRLLERLKAFAEPFVDTPETVIDRALDALQAIGADASVTVTTADVAAYDPAQPPSLTHTKVLAITLEGEVFPHKALYWNYLMTELVMRAHKSGMSGDEIRKIMPAQSTSGRKEDEGYKFIPEIGISIQGQDSIGAWRNIAALTKALNLSLTVDFMWLENNKAANPGQKGRFELRPR